MNQQDKKTLASELPRLVEESKKILTEYQQINRNSILENIPVIKRSAIPSNMWELIDDIIFGDNRLNAFQRFRLVDRDVCALEDETPAEIVTKWLRSMHITEDYVLFDMTW